MDHPDTKDPTLAKFSLRLATLRKDGYANQYRQGVVTTQSMMNLQDWSSTRDTAAKGRSVCLERNGFKTP